MEKFWTGVNTWMIYMGGAVLAYNNELIGIFILFAFFFITDFISGFLASVKMGHGFKSSKARWSFAKSFCYFGSFSVIVFMGIALRQADFFLGALKVAVYSATWFECVSNLENLLILFPDNRFLRFIYYILAVEWVKKIPGLSNFLKEEKSKKVE
ncbi:MAG: phage holin family protein [Bacteroidales bacterium]